MLEKKCIGHQYSKDVTNIEIQSSTSTNCPELIVTNTTVTFILDVESGMKNVTNSVRCKSLLKKHWPNYINGSSSTFIPITGTF